MSNISNLSDFSVASIPRDFGDKSGNKSTNKSIKQTKLADFDLSTQDFTAEDFEQMDQKTQQNTKYQILDSVWYAENENLSSLELSQLSEMEETKFDQTKQITPKRPPAGPSDAKSAANPQFHVSSTPIVPNLLHRTPSTPKISKLTMTESRDSLDKTTVKEKSTALTLDQLKKIQENKLRAIQKRKNKLAKT